MQEYLQNSETCRNSLFKIGTGVVIDENVFMHSLKYIIQFKMGRPCILYDCKLGLIDFSINSVRFRFSWPPIDNAILNYSHLESTRVFDCGYEILCEDPLYDFIKLIEFHTLYTRPNDV